jgi:hypothetical protein
MMLKKMFTIKRLYIQPEPERANNLRASRLTPRSHFFFAATFYFLAADLTKQYTWAWESTHYHG